MIRKAYKSDITFYLSNDIQDMDFISGTHVDNIRSLGGIPKPESFFKNIPEFFSDDEYQNFYC